MGDYEINRPPEAIACRKGDARVLMDKQYFMLFVVEIIGTIII
jgi:hypothetical protein